MKEKRRKIQKENEDVTDKHRKEEVFGVFERERERGLPLRWFPGGKSTRERK